MTKKNKVEDTEGLVEETVEEETTIPKKELIKLLVQIPGQDEEGNRTVLKYEAEGYTAEELLPQISLPKGLTANAKLTITKQGESLLRSISGAKVRAIFDNKNVDVLKAVFRGLL